MTFDEPTMTSGAAPAAGAIPEGRIGLADALRLSTRFSTHSNSGDVPDDLEIPIPRSESCTFVIRSWGEVSDAEREAFRRFYVRFGKELEDLAQQTGDDAAVDIDEATWSEISGHVLRQQAAASED